MKVKDLIGQLEEFDPEARVEVSLGDLTADDLSLSWYAPAEGMAKLDSEIVTINPIGVFNRDKVRENLKS